ncbi:hypothetical protein [Blastococcus saxobsidens]|uniref:Uncharacterized protein n=1 Tax=Blastococcus saxobsidens TaxID=138336 RepID=A0A4Q7Y5X1_9ACTN|nr:hypothetical protein [Blastococcus saxobsidens]RZU32280.1 hypothetical protein BKA19_1975 [Blastococcus saxobsidens]
MQFAAATPAPAGTATQDRTVVFLRDIDDLHDADLDLVLADRLAESAGALRAAVEAATLSLQIGAPAAVSAHVLGESARRLAS